MADFLEVDNTEGFENMEEETISKLKVKKFSFKSRF